MCIKYSADITTYDMSIIYYKINSENDKVKWTWNYYINWLTDWRNFVFCLYFQVRFSSSSYQKDFDNIDGFVILVSAIYQIR